MKEPNTAMAAGRCFIHGWRGGAKTTENKIHKPHCTVLVPSVLQKRGERCLKVLPERRVKSEILTNEKEKGSGLGYTQTLLVLVCTLQPNCWK